MEDVSQRIQIFYEIRDIPYVLPLSIHEDNYACLGKNLMLKKKLERLGLKVYWKEGEFRWQDMKIPKHLYRFPHEAHPTHVWLEVEIDGSPVTVDATWDPGFSGLFHINEWDGKSSQKIAVPITRMIPDEEVQIYEEPLPEWEEIMQRERDFIRGVNEWLQSRRITAK